MKKKLSQAIAVATLVGAAGMASAAAMHVNGNGVGDVLLYPLYTADNGNDTYISLTNTANQFKAVKVRILEHKNSQEVLDFNLYLSPYDKWSAVVTLDGNGNPLIKTYDTSCTVGQLPAAGKPFTNQEYAADSDATLERARVGHIEVIEMGTLDPEASLIPGVKVRDAIEHVDGVPGNCSAVQAAFRNANGLWFTNVNDGFVDEIEVGNDEFEPVASSLYGTGSVINVDAGWQASYDAVALTNTYVDGQVARHAQPQTIDPDFSKLNPEIVLFGGDEFEMTDDNGVSAGTNAVSALLSKVSIMNDYVAGANLNAQTDFVITFPTKKEYVNQIPAVRPFTNSWSRTTSTACESVAVDYWDTEENQIRPEVSDFSPPPPPEVTDFSLCYETNIFHVGVDSNLFGGGLKAHDRNYTMTLADGFQAGWIRFDFENKGHVLNSEADKATFEGLPIIGFSTIAIQNGNVGGLLSNYASTYEHKAKPAIVTPGDTTPL